MKFFIFHGPSKNTKGLKARADSAQGPSGTFPSTSGNALGAPKAAYEPSKDLLKPLQIAPQRQGRRPEPPKCNTRSSKASKYGHLEVEWSLRK